MYIFHIPSNFPTRHTAIAGISAKDFIHAFSNEYPDTHHTVSLFFETTYHALLKSNKFLTELPRYLLKKNEIEVLQLKDNLNYCHAKKSLVYSSRLGYNEKRTWLKSHRGNLKYIIEKYGKPDIIHAQFTGYGGWVAWKLSREFSIPYIITERFGPFPPSHFIKKNTDKLSDDIYFAMKEASALVSVSESHALDIRKFIDRKVFVIHNLVDEELFVPLTYQKVNRSDNLTFITITSSYQPNKGIKDLLMGISILKRKGFCAKFIIGGGAKDDDFRNLKTIARELDIEKEIEWTGKLNREEVASRIQHCDCFISPSIYESFGLVCTEAIACGKPVIATRSGGPESIINETNGLLVETSNSEMLANAMQNMIMSIQKYDPVLIRQDFIKRFSRRAIASQYYELYNAILK